MMRIRRARATGATLAMAGALLIVPACAHVSQDEMQEEMELVRADLREEMRQGDEAVEERLGNRVSDVESRLVALEGELDQLREDFNVTVERLESAVRFNAPVHFAFDDATLRSQDRPVLERFADVVSAYYEGATITVEGFTDSAGSQAYNLELGQERAESVMDFLTSQGLPAGQLRAVSYGKAENRQLIPGAQGPGEEGWQNRRVAMVIDFGPDASERAPITAARDGG